MATKLEWNDAGFGAILQDPKLQQVCLDAARSIAGKAGEGFEASPWISHGIGKVKYDRVAAVVSAETYKARRAEATDKVLQKAVTACSTGSK